MDGGAMAIDGGAMAGMDDLATLAAPNNDKRHRHANNDTNNDANLDSDHGTNHDVQHGSSACG